MIEGAKVPKPNDALRAAREGAESPSSPGQPMTRQELADAVNAQVYRATGKVASIDDNHIGKWERGDVQWPAAHYRAALRVIFDAATDAELGFGRRRNGCNPDDVDRKTFLKTTLGVGAGVALSGSSVAGGSGDLIAFVSGPTEHYRRMESAVSSQYLSPAVEGHLRLANDVVRGKLRSTNGFAVLSEIAGLSAWLAVDRGDAATARARYMDSIRYAESAGHQLLVSYMTASLGHYAVEVGDPHQGLRLLDKAGLNLGDEAPTPARAWLASLRAVAHAAIGDQPSTTRALRSAERLANRRADTQWPWVFPFTSAKVARYQSSALARLGDLRGARAAYSSALPKITAPKPRALAQVEYAQLLATQGQVDESCQLAEEAIVVGKEYGSERIVSSVRSLRGKLPAKGRAVADLDDAMVGLYDRGRR